MDVDAVMHMDIDEARAMLNIGRPETYRECLRILEAEGKLGEDLMAPAQAMAA